MLLKKLLLSLSLGFLSFSLVSQTTLSLGDLAIVGIDGQTTLDQCSFMCLVDIDAGTVFYFSDIDLDGTMTIPNGDDKDGVIRYIAPTDLPKGSVISYAETVSGVVPGPEFTRFNGDFQYAGAGDNVTIYQGTDSVTVTTYLHIAGKNGFYGIPPVGFTAITDFGSDEHGEYRGRRESTADDLFDSIVAVAQWFTSTGSPGALDLTDFRVGYYWDGTTWAPSSPAGLTGIDDDIIVAGTLASLAGTASTSGDLIVDPAATIDITGSLTVDSAFIQSSASGQGQVKGSVTGDVEFQSYITSATARWFNVGSPVDGALSTMSITNGGLIRTDADGPTANTNIYWYDPNTATDLDPGIPVDNEGTWTPAADQTPASNSRGWSIYLGGGTTFGTLPMTISTFGSLNNGNVNTNISTANKGWNFVTNPYAAAIDWNAVIVDNGSLGSVYYIRDDENGAWESYDGSLPVNRRYIPAGQAFFVSTSSPTTLAFQEDQIDMTQTPSLFKTQSPENIMLSVSTSSHKSDFTVLTLRSGASDQRDNVLDGVKRMNDGNEIPSIYTVLQGQEYVFKKIDNSFKTRTVPVHLDHAFDDELTISVSNLTVDPNMSIELEDKLSGDMIDLRQQDYTFRHLSANAPDRFVLHLSQSSIGIGEEAEAGNEIFAYAQGETVFVNLESISQDVTIQLFDMGGKMLLNESALSGQVQELSLPSQSQGVYLLKVVADGQLLHSQKIMK